MKELLKKMFASIAKSATLLKEGKTDEAVAELEEGIKDVSDETIDSIQEPTPAPAVVEPTPEELEKTANTEKLLKSLGTLEEKQLTSLVKWASICVDAPELGDLMHQLMEVKDILTSTGIQKLFEDVKTLNNTTVSKQDKTIEKSAENSLGVALMPTA